MAVDVSTSIGQPPQFVNVFIGGHAFVFVFDGWQSEAVGVLCGRRTNHHDEQKGFEDPVWLNVFRLAHKAFEEWNTACHAWVNLTFCEDVPSARAEFALQFQRAVARLLWFPGFRFLAPTNEYEKIRTAYVTACQIALDHDETMRSARDRKRGYVYLLKSVDGSFKIGCTRNPEDRRRTFEVKLPFRVEYLALIKTSNMRWLEAELHREFQPKRINGEWFALDDQDVAEICSLQNEEKTT